MSTTTAPAPASPAAERPPPRRRGRRSSTAPAQWTPYLFLAPYVVLFTSFIVAPAAYGVWISLHDWDYLRPRQRWLGLDNYRNLFDSSTSWAGDFWQSMGATGIFTLLSVPLLVVLPLLVALLLVRGLRGTSFFRAVVFAPYVLGVSVVGVLWQFILDPNIGLLNQSLARLGLPADTPWTTGQPWAWVSLVGLTVWWTLGFNAVIYIAGLQDIPRELYEAARIDGAGRWQEFRYVTLPGLRPVALFVVTVTVLASANMFGQSYLVTQGGPAESTRTAIMYIAEHGLREFHLGRAAAMGYVLAFFLAVVSVLNFRFFARSQD